jgi:hypothetical protein
MKNKRVSKVLLYTIELLLDLFMSAAISYALFALILGEYKAHTWSDFAIWCFTGCFLSFFLGLQVQRIK